MTPLGPSHSNVHVYLKTQYRRIIHVTMATLNPEIGHAQTPCIKL